MSIPSSMYASSALIFKLTQQIDYLYKKLDTCSLLLNEIDHLPSFDQARPIQLLSRDLRKRFFMLQKLQQKVRELMESDLPIPVLELIDALYYQLEELWQIHHTLTTKTERIKMMRDNMEMHLSIPAYLNA